jgi:hypothetical protein
MNIFKRFRKKKPMNLAQRCLPSILNIKESISCFSHILKEVEQLEECLNYHQINVHFSWQTPEIPSWCSDKTTLWFHWEKNGSTNSYQFRLGRNGDHYSIHSLKEFYLADVYRFIPDFLKAFENHFKSFSKAFPQITTGHSIMCESICTTCNKTRSLICKHCQIYLCRDCRTTSKVLGD